MRRKSVQKFGREQIMLSDARNLPDWRNRLAQAAKPSRVILRDYDHPDRPALAADMAAICRRHSIGFSVAGDARLARKHRAGFHCPGHMIARLRHGHRPSDDDTAAAHNLRELTAAKRAGFRAVLISPVFPTASHPTARPLGTVRAAALALQAQHLGLRPLALGGMDARRWQRLAGTAFAGFAAISAFSATRRKP